MPTSDIKTLSTDDVGLGVIGRTIETTLANGASIKDRVVGLHVEISLTTIGRGGPVRHYLLLEHVRPSRTSFELLAAGDYADWIALQPNSALHVHPETEATP